MAEKLLKGLHSYKTTIILLAVYAVIMAAATIVEKFYGTETAKVLIYYSPLFIFLHLLMAANFLAITIRRKMYVRGKIPYMAIHLAFIIMMAGAMTTHLVGEEGLMHLREGERSSTVLLKDGMGQKLHRLPFEIELQDFILKRYPGSQSPSSYESDIRVYADGGSYPYKIYMNNVLDVKGYRFFQASFDQDEKGTVLSFNRDRAGRYLTYTGYLILFLGLLLSFFNKGSRFRFLWNRLNALKALLLCATLAASSAAVQASTVPVLVKPDAAEPATADYTAAEPTAAERTAAEPSTAGPTAVKPAIAGLSTAEPSTSVQRTRTENTGSAGKLAVPAAHLELFSRLPLLSAQGRVIPLNTFAGEIVRKLKLGEREFAGTPEEFVLSVLARPAYWASQPLIQIKSEEIGHLFQMGKGRISYEAAFDGEGNYRLAEIIGRIYRKNPAERSKYEKDLLKLDDRMNVLHDLLDARILGMLPVPAPASTGRYLHNLRTAAVNGQWAAADLSLEEIAAGQLNARNAEIVPQKLKAEVFYNRMDLPGWCKRGYLLLGLLLALLGLSPILRHRKSGNALPIILSALIGGFFLLHTLSLGIRWYISGYAPWSNSYETMVALAWASVLGGLIFAKRNPLVLALATLFAGVVLFVSGLSWMDPQITPLVPVLKSPWLMAHVAALVMAYGLLGICLMLGTAAQLMSVSRKEEVRRLMAQMTLINEMAMLLGVALLTAGIFIGAIWANESWGRYWSWDPKETWALITLVIYAIVLHVRWFWPKGSDRLFNLLSQLSFLAILMTFLGVNYFLSGMHSYGNSDLLSSIPVYGYVLFVLFFTVPGLTAWGIPFKKNR